MKKLIKNMTTTHWIIFIWLVANLLTYLSFDTIHTLLQWVFDGGFVLVLCKFIFILPVFVFVLLLSLSLEVIKDNVWFGLFLLSAQVLIWVALAYLYVGSIPMETLKEQSVKVLKKEKNTSTTMAMVGKVMVPRTTTSYDIFFDLHGEQLISVDSDQYACIKKGDMISVSGYRNIFREDVYSLCE